MITCVGRVTFNPMALLGPARQEMRRRVVKAAFHLEGKLKAKVGKPGNAMNKRARQRDGVKRSAPGEPPMKQTGFGQRNITVRFTNMGFTAQVGIFENAQYMVYLEFGTEVRAGEPHILPRPWLRPTLAEESVRVHDILNSWGTR
ncbi:MAG: HK97 gp10 family phage protein [Planctomycetes bacterium]|nr:HK97 gp10 family phage protein [Planctomycetota bacterium]